MNTQSSFWKSLNILNFAFIVGLTVFTGIFLLFISMGIQEAEILDLGPLQPYVFVIAAVFLFLGMNVGRMYFRNKMEEIPQNANFDDKLQTYRSAFIIRAALVEAPAILVGLFAYMLSNPKLLILSALGIIILIIRRPIKQKMIEELKLTPQQQKELEM